MILPYTLLRSLFLSHSISLFFTLSFLLSLSLSHIYIYIYIYISMLYVNIIYSIDILIHILNIMANI